MENKSMFQTLKDMPSSQKNIEKLKKMWHESETTVLCIGLLIGAVAGFLLAGKFDLYIWAWNIGDPQMGQGFFGGFINLIIALTCVVLAIVLAAVIGGAIGGAGLFYSMATIRAIYIAIMSNLYVVFNKNLLTAELDVYVNERAEKLNKELFYLSMPLKQYRAHCEIERKYPDYFK